MEIRDSSPSRDYSFEELSIGQEITQELEFTQDIVQSFMELSKDWSPVHSESNHASLLGFQAPIVNGLLVVTPFSRLIGTYLPGKKCVIQSNDFQFRMPTYCREKLEYKVTICRLNAALKLVEMNLSVSSGTDIHVSGKCRCQLLA